MDEILTIEEINQRYPDQWVLIGDPKTDESIEVLGGKVLFHGKSRQEMYEAASALPVPRRFATLFTGKCPEHLIL